MWTMLIAKIFGTLLLIFSASLISDWIFSGSKWAHTYFQKTPEIWRPVGAVAIEGSEKSEQRVIGISLFMTLIFSITFMLFYFVMRPGLIFSSIFARGFATAGFLWMLIPLPHIITTHLFVKYHPATSCMQLMNWFVKLVCASFIMIFLF